jgi:hypothetical protein
MFAGLQKRIVQRMREFGMTPVLPAFAGFVPPQLADRVPSARITRLPNWGHFPEPFCCMPLLDPLDPLFTDIGAAFVKVRHFPMEVPYAWQHFSPLRKHACTWGCTPVE